MRRSGRDPGGWSQGMVDWSGWLVAKGPSQAFWIRETSPAAHQVRPWGNALPGGWMLSREHQGGLSQFAIEDSATTSSVAPTCGLRPAKDFFELGVTEGKKK